MIVDGLGQLSDGQTGPDNREDARGYQWVSRRRSTRTYSDINLDMIFFFIGWLA